MTAAPPQKESKVGGSGRGELVLAAGLAGVGLYMLLVTPDISTPASEYGLGPRAFPYAVGAAMVAVGCWLFVAVLRGDRGEAEGGEDVDTQHGTHWPTLLRLAGILAVYVLILDPLGYLLSNMLLFGGVAWTLGSRNWRMLVLLSVVFPLVVYLLFTRALGLFIPNGILQAVI